MEPHNRKILDIVRYRQRLLKNADKIIAEERKKFDKDLKERKDFIARQIKCVNDNPNYSTQDKKGLVEPFPKKEEKTKDALSNSLV